MFPIFKFIPKAVALLSNIFIRCFCGCCVDMANISSIEPIPVDKIEPTLFSDKDYGNILEYNDIFSQSEPSENS